MDPIVDALAAVTCSRDLQVLKARHGRPAVVAAWQQLPEERRALIKLIAAFDGLLIPEEKEVPLQSPSDE